MSQIEIIINIPCKIQEKDGWCIASCPALDLSTQGKNNAEARENLIEALHLFIESCFERGTLEQVLRDCGFSPAPAESSEPLADTDFIPIRIPFHSENSNLCHA